MTIRIDYKTCVWETSNGEYEMCLEDGGCVSACPTGALYRDTKLHIREDDCTDCNACTQLCDLGALILE